MLKLSSHPSQPTSSVDPSGSVAVETGSVVYCRIEDSDPARRQALSGMLAEEFALCSEAGSVPADGWGFHISEAPPVRLPSQWRWIQLAGTSVPEGWSHLPWPCSGGTLAQLCGLWKRLLRSELDSLENELLGWVYELSLDLIAILDARGYLRRVNPAIPRLLGYSVEELLSRPLSEFMHPDDRASSRMQRERMRTGSPTVNFRNRYLARDGRVIVLLWSGSYVAEKDLFFAVGRDITDLEQAREAAREAEMELAETRQNTSDGIVVFDADWTYLYLNQEAERLSALPRESMIGKKFWDVFPDLVDSVYWKRFHQARDSGQATSFPAYVESLDSWFETRAYPTPEGGLRVHFHDVSEKQRNLERLRQSEERFALVARATSDAIRDWDTVRNEIWWSEGFHKLFGHARAGRVESITSWTDRIHPEERDLVLDEVYRLMANPDLSVWNREYRFARADGSYAVVQDRAEVVRDPEGKALRLVGGLTDITEQRRTQDRLRDQAALLDMARDAIILTDCDGKILYWNQGAERVYGWEIQEALGREVSGLIYRESTGYQEASEATRRHGEWSGELLQFDRNGKALTADCRWTLVRDEAGEPRATLAIHTDVTERKKLEMQFFRAQRLESLGTLAGGIAHDLNNVLTPILLSTDLLRNQLEDPEQVDTVTTIEDSARRGTELVRQVLAFARGKPREQVPVFLDALLHDLRRSLLETFPKHVQCQVTVDADCWAVRGDPTQIHQVFLNLCLNARDAMPGGGQLQIGTENVVLDEHFAAMHQQASAGAFVLVKVCDTGIGIGPDAIDKVFEPFFTSKELGKGTGLGLSTALSIVRGHGGFMQVYSEPGKGTTFKVYLPADLAAPGGPGSRPGPALPRGKGELVLVVDDEEPIRHLTRRTLETFGYRVLTAADGAEALAIYAQNLGRIAAVITDMMMPVMDGLTTIRALHRIDPEARIIAASGLDFNGDVARGASAKVRHFLPKPYTADALLNSLAAMLHD